jgi:hypothetical protein
MAILVLNYLFLIILALLSYDIKNLHSIFYCILVLWLYTELSYSPLFPLIFSDGSVHNTFEGGASTSSVCDNGPRHMAI